MDETWVFGYGSLIWNPGFRFVKREVSKLEGWQLRFWQASSDHRGTPDFPGRVATLVPHPDGVVWGIAYALSGNRQEVLDYLDYREKGGYERHLFEVQTTSGSLVSAISYVGLQSLDSYVGPEDEVHTARIISQATGPSGANIEYLKELHKSLASMPRTEPHVNRLVSLLS